MTLDSFSRRSFLALAGAAPFVAAAAGKRVPLGLELYSVRDEMKKDAFATVKAVGKMGYQGVEFYGPYFDWKPDYAKQMRKVLDDLKIRCYSTHNNRSNFNEQNLPRAIELNQILGAKYIVMASAGKVQGIDGWKSVADDLNKAAEKTKAVKMGVGYHNHKPEFLELEGKRPIEVLAASTTKDVMLQFDVGTCVEAGCDPVAWIDKNPGRIRSIHCKDWSPDPNKGYKVLFGDGASPWKKIFQAAEKSGGVEYYLIEQEGSDYPSIETVEKCLAAFKKIHG